MAVYGYPSSRTPPYDAYKILVSYPHETSRVYKSDKPWMGKTRLKQLGLTGTNWDDIIY